MSSVWDEQIQTGIKHLADNDPFLATIIRTTPTPTIEAHENYYQALVESIVSQQLSVKAADTITKRFIGLFASDFPTPDDILAGDPETYRAAGLSWQKISYITDLARRVIDGSVDLASLNTLSNDEIIAELVQVKGIGVWTVHMFLMFCMGRLNVLPVGDLGIKNGIQKLYALPEKPDAEGIEAIAAKYNWKPYQTLASWYIWHSLDNAPKL